MSLVDRAIPEPAGLSRADEPSVRGIARLVNRPLPAVAVVLSIYVILAAFNAGGVGFLSTDTGGKVATLEAMSQRGDLSPDVGYWAAQHDPEGRLHPFANTEHRGDKWVNVTTLPMLYAAYPLYQLGGYRMALLLPMLGAVTAAMAGRTLAERFRSGAGWRTYWVLALASPLTVYALDFWEHTWGVALVLWAVELLHRGVVDRREVDLQFLIATMLAGSCLGMAASMRSETLVFGFVAVGLACVALLRRRLVLTSLVTGVVAGFGFATTQLASVALERWAFGTSIRTGRSTATASRVGEELAQRIEEAAVTCFGLFPSSKPGELAFGALALGLIIVASAWAVRGNDRAEIAMVLAALLLGLRVLVGGLGFVPGAAMAAPLAGVGLAIGWRIKAARLAIAMIAVATPGVWAFQFLGGAVPQWGGRYILPATILLVAVGVVALGDVGIRVRGLALAMSLAMTAVGVGWTHQRTVGFETTMTVLADRTEQALVFEPFFLAREAGPLMLGERWLTVGNEDDLEFATQVLAATNTADFGLVKKPSGQTLDEALAVAPRLGDFVPSAAGYVEMLSLRLIIITYIDPSI